MELLSSDEVRIVRRYKDEFKSMTAYILTIKELSHLVDVCLDGCREAMALFNQIKGAHIPDGADNWAEAWYDHETKDFHCCVRTVLDGNVRVYGPNPEQKYCKPAPNKTLRDFAEMINHFPWDHFTTHRATFNLDTERAKSREYKAWLKQTEMKTALAMALHERLGAGSGIATLGGDLIAECVERI